MTLPLHGFPDWQVKLATADLEQVIVNQVINAGGLFSTPIQDVRLYSSIAVKCNAFTNAPATAFNWIRYQVIWFRDAAGTDQVFSETWEEWVTDFNPGPFVNGLGLFNFQDVIHGPYVRISALNIGVDQVTANFTILGNSRSIPGQYVRSGAINSGVQFQQSPQELWAVTAFPIGAGATITKPLPIAPGRVHYFYNQTTAQNLTFFDSAGQIIEQIGPAGPFRGDFNMGNNALLATIFNAGAAGQFSISLMNQRTVF